MKSIETIEDIQKLVQEGFTDWQQYGDVNAREYDDLLIFSYNTIAQYKGEWNFFERVSRGLIIHKETGEIVARPFDKFFNWFQQGRRASGHIVVVLEKMDGSLGILYRHQGQFKIATRGTLDSEQALWATKHLNDNYDLSELDESLTLLFEIIYPENRVVVDYGGFEGLVLLAARNRFTGDYIPFFPDVYELAEKYGFMTPQVHSFNNITEILEATDTLDETEEGWVVEFSDGERYKFKGDRYLELHKLITEISKKRVLVAIRDNTLNYILDTIPDEFLRDIKTWIAEIEEDKAALEAKIETAYEDSPKDSRKTFATYVMEHYPTLSRFLFDKFDGKSIRELVFRELGRRLKEG